MTTNTLPHGERPYDGNQLFQLANKARADSSTGAHSKERKADDADQKRQLLGFFANKFRKTANPENADSRNHGQAISASYKVAEPYKDSSTLQR